MITRKGKHRFHVNNSDKLFLFRNTIFLSKQLRKSRVSRKIRYQVNYSTYFWFMRIVHFSRADEIGNKIYLSNNVERIVVPIMRSLCS